MLVAAWHILRSEQQRAGRQRQGIMVFTSIFMSFCLLLALLSAYVQIAEGGASRSAEQKLASIRAAADPLLNARAPVIESLPDDLPQKRVLQTISNNSTVVICDTKLSRFCSEAPWREDAVYRRRIRFMVQQTTSPRRWRRESLVVIDATLCAHVGSLFDHVDRHDNHGDGT
jgi:hypothetical protein